MKQVIDLIKKDFNNSFITKIKYMIKNKKEWGKILLSIFLLIMMGAYLYFGISYLIDWIGEYDRVGKGYIYLMQSTLVYTMFIILGAVPAIISNFYFSNDVRIMLPLPIKTSNIIISKILYNLIGALSLALVIVAPFTIKYASFYSKSIVFYISFILGLIAHTTILLAILTLLVVAIMAVIGRFTRIKSVLQVIGTILIMLISFGFSYLVNAGAASGTTQMSIINSLVQSVEAFLKYIPSLGLLSKTLEGSIFAFIGLVILAILLIYAVSYLAQAPLLKGIQYNHVVGKRKKLSKERVDKVYKERPIILELILKDLRDILKTPVYFTNTLMIGIIIPIAFMVPFIAQKGEIQPLLDSLPNLYGMMENVLSLDKVFALALLASMALLMFMASSATGTAGTSISREGKFFWLSQSLPIEVSKQVLSRIISAIIIYFLSILPLSILIFVVAKPPYYLFLPYLIAFISVAIFTSSLGVFLDSIKPKLEWQTPQQVMKMNMIVFILSLSTMILAGLSGFGIYKLINSEFIGSQMLMISLIASTSLIIFGIIFYSLAIKSFKKLVNQN